MKKKLRVILLAILAAVFIYCVVRIIMTEVEYKQAENIYEESRTENFHMVEDATSVQHQASGEPSETAGYFPNANVDFDKLISENPDIVGWVYIPETNINYPLLRAENNQKYLGLSYNLQWTSSGSIFVDFRNSSDFSDDNTVIYGHNMKNGGMFGSLKKYADNEYLKEHSDIYIFTKDKILKYQVFAAYKTESDSESYTREFSEDFSYDDYIKYVISSAGSHVNEAVEEQTPLMMLSTCTSERRSERFVVNAVLIAVKENDEK